MTARADAAVVFEEQRSYLFSIAYRLLGSVTSAEDMVQDAFLRWEQARPDDVRSPRAFLATVVVRLCMDELRSARAKREVYVGQWLPEPLMTTGRADLTDTLVLRESLSFAFLLMLEKLSPLERAVFVLREVFDYDYSEIALMVEKSEANCRQVFHRARQRLSEAESRYETTRAQQERVTEQFLKAATSGDVQAFLQLLAEDVVAISDGGGKSKVPAALQPVRSRDRVSRGLFGGLQKLPPDRAWIDEVNGQPAIVATLHGEPYAVLLLGVRGDQVQHIYLVANPDKLGGLFSPRDPDRNVALG